MAVPIILILLSVIQIQAAISPPQEISVSPRAQLDEAMRLRLAFKYNEALTIYEQFQNHHDFTVADFMCYSFSLARRAIIHRDSSQPDKMKYDIDYAIFLAEKHHPYKYTVNTRIYYYKAMSFLSSNNDSAIYYYDKAIETGYHINFEELNTWQASLEWMQLSDAYLYKAEVLMKSVFDYEAAFESLRHSLMAAAQIEDTLRAFNQRIFIDYHLSEFYQLTGDHHTALHYINRVIEMCNQLPDPNRYHWMRNYYYAKAMIHNKTGDHDEALHWFNHCKNMFSKTHQNDRYYYLQLHTGNIWHEWQDYEKADSCYDAALAEYHTYRSDSITPGTRLFYQMYYQRKLENAGKSGDMENARHMAQCLINNFNHVNAQKCQVAAGSFQSVARHFRFIEEFDSTLYYSQKALIALHQDFNDMDIMANPVTDQAINKIIESELLKEKGEILLLRSLDGRSKEAAVQTLLLAEQRSFNHLRLRYSARSKTDLMSEIYDVYELIFEALLSKADELSEHDLLLVEKLMRRSKSVVLKDYLKKSTYQNLLSTADSLLLQQIHIYKEINKLNEKLKLESTKENPNEQLISSITERIVLLRRDDELLRLAMRIQGTQPLLRFEEEMNLNSTQKQGMGPSKKDINLHYYWGDKHIYAFVETSSGRNFLRLGTKEEISKEVTNYLSLLADVERIYDRKYYQNFIASSHQVYNSIVAPVLLLVGVENFRNPKLNLVPDGLLFYIPFESLITTLPVGQEIQYNELPYLIHKVNVSFYISVRDESILHHKKNFKKNPKILALFSSGGSENEKHSNFLTYSRHELEALKRHFPDGAVFNEGSVNKHIFSTDADKYDIIHFSSHGHGNIHNGHLSYLTFSPDDQDEDNRLYAFEVLPMNLNARLAVLNACETGKGELLIGEGAMSMAHGFLYAGIPSVVTSLMEVHDRTGAAIISGFYEYVIQGKRLNNALRNSKLDYLAKSDELTAHPVTWSTFVLIGQSDALFNESILNVSSQIIIFLIFLVFMIVFIYKKIVILH